MDLKMEMKPDTEFKFNERFGFLFQLLWNLSFITLYIKEKICALNKITMLNSKTILLTYSNFFVQSHKYLKFIKNNWNTWSNQSNFTNQRI